MTKNMFGKTPPITKNIIIINALLFLGSIVANKYGIDLNKYFALYFFKADNFNLAQLFTYMFMHANFSHLFFNMFAVWMFGRILEQTWGQKRFLFYYIFCGIGAGLTQEIIQFIHFETVLAQYSQVQMQNAIIPMHDYLNLISTVGASGAVYGILLAFGMTWPDNKIFIFPLPVPIKAKFFVIGYAVIELYMALANNPNDTVAHFAHLGGMIFGLFVILYWKKKGKNNGRFYF